MDSAIHIRIIWLIICAISFIFALCFLISSLIKERNKSNYLYNQLKEKTTDLNLQEEKTKTAIKAKNDFLSRMSHEIRTPLNAIIGMTQIAQNTSDRDKIVYCLGKAVDSSKHLLGLINDILDFSKIEADTLVLEEKLFSLQNDIEFVTSMLKEKITEKNIELHIALNNITHDGIITDMLRLNQVLINLLSNAVKFTDNGGIIVLTVEEIVHLKGESVYSFSVRDNGVGIDLEHAKKLFTPFTQANNSITRLYGGTGLGLSISQSIVKMMGGEIELETELGKGSVFQFTIRVPAKENALSAKESTSSLIVPEKLQGKRILIVDDVEINLEVATALLEDSGALIETAVNGKNALDVFCSSAPYWYDVILMDMLMPVMDGCAATMEIRNSARVDSKTVCIIAMTANVLSEDMARAYQAGMNGYLTKPIELKELYTAMEDLL